MKTHDSKSLARLAGFMLIEFPVALLIALFASGEANAANRVVAWGHTNFSPEMHIPLDLTNVVGITANYFRDLALKADGTVVALVPRAVEIPTGLSNVVAITICGESVWLALKADGTVVSWGEYINGLTNVPPGLSNVVAIAGSFVHSLALRADGTVVGWGKKFGGRIDVPLDLSNVVAIAAGGGASLALKSDGTVVAWGDNFWGELEIPAGLSNVVAIAAAGTSSLALKEDGSVVSWGTDHAFDLPLHFPPPPTLSNAVAIAGSQAYALALKADGTVVAWGDPTYDGVVYEWGVTNVPSDLTNVIAIATGADHNLALVGDGPPVLRAPMTNPRRETNGFSVSVVTQSGKSIDSNSKLRLRKRIGQHCHW